MRTRSLVVLAGMLLAATSTFAAPQHRDADNSQTAAVDAQGRLRGLTPEEIRQYAASFKPRPTVMRITALANGMGSMALDESFDHHMMARLNGDGSAAFACSDDHSELLDFVSQAAPADTILRVQRPAAARTTAERE